MTLWFNEDKSGIKIIRGDLMDEAIEFSEAILYKTETSYLLVGEFTQITNLKKSGVDNFDFTPQICLTEIHHSAYSKKVKDGDNWKSSEFKPNLYEKSICKIIEHYPQWLKENTVIKGCILFNSDTDLILQVLQASDLFDLLDKFCRIEIVESPIHLTAIGDVIKKFLDKATYDGTKGGYKVNETERLQQRFEWLRGQLRLPGSTIKDITDIAEMLEGWQTGNPALHANLIALIRAIM